MIAWQERPTELAHLFNPAFCGALLVRAVNAYALEASRGMPFSIGFLVLPIILHEPTRETLPASKSTSLLRWVQRQPEVRIGFADRLRSLVPYTREALIFSMSQRVLSVEHGRLEVRKKMGAMTRLGRKSEEAKQCASKATLVGKMLALAGEPATIFATWGVRP